MNTQPLTNYERVKRSKAKAISSGGRRFDGILSQEVATALDALLDARYADTAIGAISKALLDAQKKLKKV